MSRQTAVEAAVKRIIVAYEDGDKIEAYDAADDLYQEGHEEGYLDAEQDREYS